MADDDYLREFRTRLEEAERHASQDLDRAILTLSSGALGVSIVFLRDLVPAPKHLGYLWTSWSLLGAAILFTVASLIASRFALRQAISDLDSGNYGEGRPLAGWQGRVTDALTWTGAAAFVAGVACLLFFVLLNYP